MIVTVGVMRCNVFKIPENCFGSECLRMEAGDNARMDLLVISPAGILVIQKQRFIVAVDYNPPTVMLRDHMNGSIQKPEGKSVVPAEIFDLHSFLPVLSCDGRAAVAKAIPVLLGNLKALKGTTILFRDAMQDFAMRKMHNLPV